MEVSDFTGSKLGPWSSELLNVEKIPMVRQKNRGRIISAESTQSCSHGRLWSFGEGKSATCCPVT